MPSFQITTFHVVHGDERSACMECIQRMYQEKEVLWTQLELLEMKNQFLQKAARGELGNAEPVPTYDDEYIDKWYVWKFGLCYAIDTKGRLYRSDDFFSEWVIHCPKKIDSMKAVIRGLQQSLT